LSLELATSAKLSYNIYKRQSYLELAHSGYKHILVRCGASAGLEDLLGLRNPVLKFLKALWK